MLLRGSFATIRTPGQGRKYFECPGCQRPLGVEGIGRCEKIDFEICSELGVKKIALGCRITDRRGVGKLLGSKTKSRKLKQSIFSHLPVPKSSVRVANQEEVSLEPISFTKDDAVALYWKVAMTPPEETNLTR
jgi:hypothetical protein